MSDGYTHSSLSSQKTTMTHWESLMKASSMYSQSSISFFLDAESELDNPGLSFSMKKN